MKHFQEFLFVGFVVLSLMNASCSNRNDKSNGNQSKNVELTNRAKKIIDLYVQRGEMTDKKDKYIFICGSYNGKHKVFDIYSYSGPIIEKMFEGQFCGKTEYAGYKISVWGNSCNGFFWKQKNKSIYVKASDKIEDYCQYDPCAWRLFIDSKDTTIIDSICYFDCDIYFPIDTFNTLLK